MALTEVKRFIDYIKKNREELEKYNEKLVSTGNYLFSEPTMLSSAGYYVSPMLPENLEDELLQKIIQLDESSAKKLEKISAEKGKKISLKDRLVIKFDAVVRKGESPKDYVLNHDEEKRHKLFSRLAQIAKEDGFDISTDDLLYFIGKAVLVVIAEHPDYTGLQILDKVFNSFE